MECNKISFVIVEYNSLNEIERCILNIKSMSINVYDFEIIVSSNSCYCAEKQELLVDKYLDAKWCFNDYNGGFAYAMNCGLKKAVGDLLVIQNPDVIIRDGVENMVNYFVEHQSIGVIAPKIVDQNGIIQDSFRNFITPFNFLTRHFKRVFKRGNAVISCDKIIQVDWVIGAFMMLSRKSYEAVKGLDDNYFLYCEDMDLCRRMYDEKYKVVYYPQMTIEYVGTRSARKSYKYACVFLRSLFIYWNKFGFL